MKSNFAKCLPEILKHEGGWADHPADPGGATMKGITIGTYRQWKGRAVTKAELKAISDDEVAAIYKRNYWDKVRGDDLPAGLDLVAFDAAVNSGPSRGATWLQVALGVAADGAIGPKTLAAAQTADAAAVINRALEVRLSFLKAAKSKGKLLWPTFGKGWGRRVEGVRKVALGMVGSKPAEAPKKPAQRAKPEAAPAQSKSRKVIEYGKGVSAGGGLIVLLLAFADDAAQAWRDLWMWVFSWF